MKKLTILLLMAGLIWSCSQPKDEPSAIETVMPMPMEFAGTQFSDIAQEGLMNLCNKNFDGFIKGFSENAVYRFSYGDSISGKDTIYAYWKDRLTNVIDKLEVSNDVWLPIKVNQSDKVRKGEWVLSWFRVNATYVTGKSMTQWVHTLYHFNESGKIDQVTQFLDRAPIQDAMTQN